MHTYVIQALINYLSTFLKWGGGHRKRQSLLKNIDRNVSKKYLYFHRIETYCIINYETFLVQGKSEI